MLPAFVSAMAMMTMMMVAVAGVGVVAGDGGVAGGGGGGVSSPLVLPLMGWSTWNTFQCEINETLVEQSIDALASSPLLAAGELVWCRSSVVV